MRPSGAPPTSARHQLRHNPTRGHIPLTHARIPQPMNSIFRGDLTTAQGRALAWLDALAIDHAVFRLVWTNFAAVAPGRLYRSTPPPPQHLAAFARRYHLKTLVNLRGQTGNGSDAL